MNNLQTPRHQQVRSVLRVVGPIVAVVGLVFMVVGAVSFFSAFGGGGSPRLFWCCFVGMPVLFVGIVICKFAYMGSLLRYMAAEMTPVATDAVNEMAEGTQGAVKTVARAAAEGVREGLREPPAEKK